MTAAALADIEARLSRLETRRGGTSLDRLARELDKAVAAAKERLGAVEPGDRRTLAECDAILAAELGRIECRAGVKN